MIYLFTGLPGAGKSLRLVQRLVEEWKVSGRPVFSNIDGLMVEGVRPAPEDWTTTPEGSIVIFDEAQEIFPADGSKGRSTRNDIAALEKHRHTGHDIALMTQHPALLHSHVRRLVNRHEHLQNVFGYDRARVYIKDKVINVDTAADLKTCDVEDWSYPKKYYGLYKSSELHTKKRRLPRRLKFVIAGMAALTLLVLATLPGLFRVLRDHHRAASAPATARRVSGPAFAPPTAWVDRDWAAVPVSATVSGCVWTQSRCKCYGPKGSPLRISTNECFRRVRQPLPFHLDVSSSAAEGPALPSSPPGSGSGGAEHRPVPHPLPASAS